MYELIYLNYIDGFVDKYIERFINAIMKRHEELFGLPNCIGFLDGSFFPIYQAPHWHPELFWC